MAASSGFKEWLHLQELKDKKPSFFTAMQDLGIPPDVMTDVPVIFTQGEMGPGGVRTIGTYVATEPPEKRDDGTWVGKVKNMDDPANKAQKRLRKWKGKWVELPRDKNDDYPEDDKEYTADDEEIDGLYSQFAKNKAPGNATGLPGGMM